MENEEFLRLCKAKVAEYTNSHMDVTDRQQVTVHDVYVVWSCKTLQNNKALLSTTVPDGMYYELTYNGDKNELYMDAYKKFETDASKCRRKKMKRRATKRIAVLMALVILVCFSATGCSEANKVSMNISQEADNFNVTRKLTVLNARTDTILLELTGTFALKNNSSNELEVIIETAEGKYQKDYVYLNDYTMYVVEDISGSDVDKYHYEINFLPQWGLKVTHND